MDRGLHIRSFWFFCAPFTRWWLAKFQPLSTSQSTLGSQCTQLASSGWPLCPSTSGLFYSSNFWISLLIACETQRHYSYRFLLFQFSFAYDGGWQYGESFAAKDHEYERHHQSERHRHAGLPLFSQTLHHHFPPGTQRPTSKKKYHKISLLRWHLFSCFT